MTNGHWERKRSSFARRSPDWSSRRYFEIIEQVRRSLGFEGTDTGKILSPSHRNIGAGHGSELTGANGIFPSGHHRSRKHRGTSRRCKAHGIARPLLITDREARGDRSRRGQCQTHSRRPECSVSIFRREGQSNRVNLRAGIEAFKAGGPRTGTLCGLVAGTGAGCRQMRGLHGGAFRARVGFRGHCGLVDEGQH